MYSPPSDAGMPIQLMLDPSWGQSGRSPLGKGTQHGGLVLVKLLAQVHTDMAAGLDLGWELGMDTSPSQN